MNLRKMRNLHLVTKPMRPTGMDIRQSDRSCNNCGNSIEQCECDVNTVAVSENNAERYLQAMLSQNANGEAKFHLFNCYRCLEYSDAYMVSDMVWNAAWPTYTQDKSVLKRVYEEKYPEYHDTQLHTGRMSPKKGLKAHALLCLECLEVGLGRALKISDFTEAKINNIVRFAYAMGLRR